MIERRLWIGVMVVMLNVAAVVYAATFVPTVRIDADDAVPGDGVCATAGGDCTLRAAIEEANALPGSDLITVPGGTYQLNRGFGPLVIVDDVEIRGAGDSSTVINGNKPYLSDPGHLAVIVGAPASAKLDNLAVRRSGTLSSCGGAIYVSPSASLDLEDADVSRNLVKQSGIGGGICNDGTLTLTNVSLTSNYAYRSLGGAIYNNGTLTINGARVRKNSAQEGGGLYNASGSLIISAATFSANHASQGAALSLNGGMAAITNATLARNTALVNGGAVYNDGTTDATLTNVTIHHNKAEIAGGIGGTGTNIVNTILSDSLSPEDIQAQNNCESPDSVISLGSNLETGSSCDLIETGDLSDANAGLGRLMYNGGAAKMSTLALLDGSDAIDSGDDTYCPATDQRGFPRPVGTCDMGAFELQ